MQPRERRAVGVIALIAIFRMFGLFALLPVLALYAAGLSGATLNIGSGTETSINDLVAAVERATGKTARALASPDQTGGVARMWADIASARETLDWAPSVDLDAGLAKVVASVRRSRVSEGE